jgi:flagellar L-ring protein precursor FlgH
VARKAALLAALALAASLLGCAAQPQLTKSTAMPMLTPEPTPPVEPYQNPGSLFSDAQSDFLFADNRARRVGDVILVNIVESSKGQNAANTKAEKSNDHSLGIGSLFGKSNAGVMPFGNALGMTGAVGSSPIVSATTSSKLDATGQTDRSGSLVATIGARVVRVMPGGTLQVEGAREMRVNNETQVIVVRGLVRQRDIGADNSIPSSSMADAKIEYYGEGVLADKQRPGWMSRLLDNVWPF